jgi:N-formylglutamate amidohydrolase
MNAWERIGAERIGASRPPEADEEAAFHVTPPAPGAPPTALVFASPHSGRIYPPGLMAASRLDAETIRRSEDAHVDDLIATAPAHGAAVIAMRVARAWLDVNRDPWELDPAMFEDELPAYARVRTARVAAGLGSIARIVGEGQEIYARKLTFAEAAVRVETVHRPYHAALADLVAGVRRLAGAAVLLDWHSMPSAAARQGAGGSCDMVLGDRFGAACAPGVSRRVEQALRARGYRVARNAPYAGGYTTEHYGRPARKVHALQIEINRAIYMDESTLKPAAGYAALKADLETVFKALATADWVSV